MHVVDRLELAAALAGVAEQLAAGTCPTSACSTSRARTGAVPMPPSVTEARVILPAASPSSSAAADVMAKSPCRRENSTKA